MKPRAATQEDADFWNDNDQGIVYKIGPMLGEHLGAEDIPAVLKGYAERGRLIIKVPWVLDERDNLEVMRMGAGTETVWTTFWGGMPPSDVVIL